MIKRRGFLGLIGGAAVAGPSMAKQAVASVGLDSMALTALPHDFGPVGGYGSTAAVGQEYDHARWLKDQIRSITGISEEERRERIASQHVSMLDPDLAANRSFSLSFKVQTQKRRNYERWEAREHRSLTRQLADHIKSIAS